MVQSISISLIQTWLLRKEARHIEMSDSPGPSRRGRSKPTEPRWTFAFVQVGICRNHWQCRNVFCWKFSHWFEIWLWYLSDICRLVDVDCEPERFSAHRRREKPQPMPLGTPWQVQWSWRHGTWIGRRWTPRSRVLEVQVSLSDERWPYFEHLWDSLSNKRYQRGNKWYQSQRGDALIRNAQKIILRGGDVVGTGILNNYRMYPISTMKQSCWAQRSKSRFCSKVWHGVTQGPTFRAKLACGGYLHSDICHSCSEDTQMATSLRHVHTLFHITLYDHQ